MRERTFVERRRAGWDALQCLLTLVERRGVRRVDGERILELGREYRAATGDLATAQSRKYGVALIAYLNGLVSRAHGDVYATQVPLAWTRVARFLTMEFPREVRRSWLFIAVCASVFVAAATIAYPVVAARPASAYALVPANTIPFVQRSLHDSNFAVDAAFAPALSTMIILNNVTVAAEAFAGGMTVGIVTLWSILQNGLMLGALAALFAGKGYGMDFWATIAPHGVIELTAIQIAGGAGLLLAAAIVAPGPLRRVDALKANGRRAVTLLVGVAALLVVAGSIEGFFSPLRTPIGARLSVGAITAVFLTLYLTTVPWPSRRDTRPGARS